MKWEQTGSLLIGRFEELEVFKGVVAVFSTRLGGCSEGPYTSLNLGLKTADHPERVRRNRDLFFHSIGISEEQTVRPSQTHSAQWIYVQNPGRYECADASFTDHSGIFLTVTVSDCVPVLFFEPRKKIAGAIHAGWRGTAQRIVYQTLTAMLDICQTVPDEIVAVIGPSVCPNCYEISDEVASQFSGDVIIRNNGNKPRLDLWRANEQQLREAGVKQVICSGLCTMERQDWFFSHRGGGGISGRMLGVIGRTKD